MALDRYRDLAQHTATKAGFQFEFFCEHCGQTWSSTFEPYRLDQLNSFLRKIQGIFRYRTDLNDTLFSAQQITGGKRKQEALARAQKEAKMHFSTCGTCRRQCCNRCHPQDARQCGHCSGGLPPGSTAPGATAAGATRCPSCQGALDGGRFCAECGYDTASFQKSCPGCSAICARQARFCSDCGHVF